MHVRTLFALLINVEKCQTSVSHVLPFLPHRRQWAGFVWRREDGMFWCYREWHRQWRRHQTGRYPRRQGVGPGRKIVTRGQPLLLQNKSCPNCVCVCACLSLHTLLAPSRKKRMAVLFWAERETRLFYLLFSNQCMGSGPCSMCVHVCIGGCAVTLFLCV